MSDDPVNLDDLTRDPDDGAYHCPRCEAPFTRRSNLRRHFVIHTRSTPFECTLCRQQFSRSDELRYHAQLCADNEWNDPSNTAFPVIPHLPLESPLNPITIYQNQDTASTSDTLTSFSQDNISESSTTGTNSPNYDTDQMFLDFLSACTIPPVPSTTVPETLYGQSVTIQGVENPPTAPSSSTSRFPPVARHRVHPRRGVQPYSGAGKRRKSKEKLIYTRRQVDDMLDAVSNCFARTMEEVVKRVDVREKPLMEKATTTSTPAPTVDNLNVELRDILKDTLPRLVTGLQGLLEEKVSS